MCTSARSPAIAAGPASQPIRHPIIRHSIETEPAVIVRSAMPSSAAGWRMGAPSNTMPSISDQ
jgi:hypothetical protein